MRVQKGSHTHFGKRALALFLSLVMCISMVQISAFATAEFNSSQQIEKKTVGEELKPVYYTYDDSEFVLTGDNAVDTQPVVSNTGDDNWKVKLSKQISGTNEENKFRIDLTVETKQRIETVSKMPDSAVALVIDISSSMRECIHCGQKENESNHTGTTKLMCPGLKDKEYKEDKDHKDRCDRDECEKKKSDHIPVTIPATCTIYKSKLQQAKEAAISFAAKFAASGMDEKSNRIAARWMSLAAFDANASQQYDDGWVDTTLLTWTKDANGSYYYSDNVLANAIRNLQPGIGTNIAGGLSVGSALLNSTPKTADDKAIESKFVLLLGDGEPYGTPTDAPTGVSSGYTDRTDEEHANTEKWARYIREAQGAKLFSVYVQRNASTDNNTYKWFQAFSNSASLAANADSLVESFDRYLTLITIGAEAWVVSDKMGSDIRFAGKVEGDSNFTEPADENGNVLTWNLRNDLPEVYDGDGNEVTVNTKEDLKALSKDGNYTFRYHFAYYINLDVTNAVAPTAHLTNGRTFLTYYLTDANGDFINDQGKSVTGEAAKLKLDFKVPAVLPLTADLAIDKYASWNEALVGTYSKEDAFRLIMLDDDGKCTINEYSGTANKGTVTFTNIPSHHTYLLKEINAPEGFKRSTDVYQVTIEGGRVTSITAGANNSNANDTVQYANNGHLKFFDELDPQPVDLTFTKHWQPSAPSTGSITITVKAYYDDGQPASGYDLTVNLDENDANNGVWTTTLEDVPTVDVSNGKTIRYLSDNASEAGLTGYAQVSAISGGWNASTNTYDAFEVTNAQTDSVTITKNWVGPHDGITSVTMAVFNGTEKVWQGSVTNTETLNLPAYDKYGSPITYTVMEVDAAGNLYGNGNEITLGTGDNEKTYTVSISGTTITNTIKQDYKDITVNKTWKVGDAADESYSATFALYADGEKIDEKTIKNPTVKAMFEHLPVYALDNGGNGHEITYTVKEVSATGTDVVMDTTEKTVTDGSVSFINTREKTQTVEVTKVWDDDSNEYGTRPDSVRLVVSAGGEYSYPVDFDSSDYYQLDSVTDTVEVPLYDEGGNELTYTVTEANLNSNNKLAGKDGSLYTPTYSGDITDGFTVTNTLEGNETSITVRKIWVDTLTDAQRAEADISTTIKLMKGSEVVDEWTTSANGTHPFTVFNYNGATYTVVETAVDGYNNGQAAEAVLKDGVYVFTNVINQDNTVEVKGTKTWDGGDSAYRPDVTFTLYANGEPTTHTKTLADVAADGSFSFTDLPKYAIDGTSCTEIQYTIQEAMSGSMAAYYKADSTAPDADANGVFNFVNRFNPGTMTVGGTKTWVDGGADHTDTTITVGLYVADQQMATKTVSMVEGAFTYSFPGLDKVDARGNTIEYAIYELDANGAPIGMGTAIRNDQVSDGQVTIGGDVYDVYYQGNSIVNKRETGTVSVGVTKVWNGPKTDITFDIFRDNETTACESITLTAADADATVESGNTWKKSISLPKFDDNGAEITYRVEERGADNGTVTLNGHTYDVSRVEGTNIFTNRVQQEYNVSVKLTKDWAETDLAVSELPESIEVYLLRDGVAYDADGNGKAEVYELTKDGNWTLTVTGLPRFQNDGSESVYSIQEVGYDQASGTVKYGSDYYKAEITLDADSTDADFDLTMTNTCLGHYAYIINRHYTYTDSSAAKTEWVESTGVTYGSKDEQVSYNAGDYVKPTTKHTDITFGFDGGTEKNEQHTTITIAAGDVTDKVMTLDNMDLFIVDLYYSKTETYVPPVNPPKDDGRKPSKPSKPPVVIEDPEVPLTPMPEEPEIEIPEVEIPEVEIPEEDVPLAEIPETGDTSAMWILAAAVSGIGLVWLSLTGKKRKEESAE